LEDVRIQVTTTVNDYHVRIVDEKNRINELIEECKYDVYGVPHIDMNEFVMQLLCEAFDKVEEAEDSGFRVDAYVLEHFGIKV
jgi:hypothetical protein